MKFAYGTNVRGKLEMEFKDGTAATERLFDNNFSF